MIPALLLGLAVAQAAAPVTLTLDEALKEARANNLDLKVAQARLRQAHELSKQVWSGYLPQLTAGGSYTRNSVAANFPYTFLVRDESKQAADAVAANGGKIPADPQAGYPGTPTQYAAFPYANGPSIAIQPLDQWGGQVQLQQALIVPALWPAIHGAYLGEQVADLNVEAAKREILFAVVQLYYGAVGAKQASGVEQQILDANLAHEKDAKVRVDAGVYPRIFLIRAQIDRTRSEQDYRSATNAYQSTISALSTLLNRAPDFDVIDPPEPPLPPDLDKSEAQGVGDRPDVQAARKLIEANQASLLSSEFSYAPNLGLTAKAIKTNSAGFVGTTAFWSIAVGLNWTLFDGGLRESNLRTAQSKVAEAEVARLSTEAKAQDELRRAKLTLETARANRVKAEEQLRLARENNQLVKVSFDAGSATYLEVTDANLALNGAELGRVAATLNAQLAVLQLAKAQGAFNPE